MGIEQEIPPAQGVEAGVSAFGPVEAVLRAFAVAGEQILAAETAGRQRTLMDLLLPEHAGHDTHLSGAVLGNH